MTARKREVWRQNLKAVNLGRPLAFGLVLSNLESCTSNKNDT